jgi:hypothetical protein
VLFQSMTATPGSLTGAVVKHAAHCSQYAKRVPIVCFDRAGLLAAGRARLQR